MQRFKALAGLLFLLAGSVAFASRLWSWVLNFDPGFAFHHPPRATGPPLSTGVTILLVDGLRLDASRRMPALNELRRRGADIEARVGTPSFSRPGRATLAVGSDPSIHGVTTNRQKRALTLDNLFRRVAAGGGSCRVAGSQIWPGLFAADIAKCGAYHPAEGKEGPGAFVRQVPGVRASQAAGIAFILDQPATLRIADIISTDFAAHEYGGASAEYQAEVLRADEALSSLASRLDFSKETLVVTADHGHRDVGGHGGDEAEVLAIPLVMVGAGIRPASRATALQADIAPTVAALLGLALPTGTSGRPIVPALLAGEEKTLAVASAAAAQQQAFLGAIAERLGAPQVAGLDGPGLMQFQRRHDREERRSIAILTALSLLVLLGAALRSEEPVSRGLTAGVAAFAVAVLGPVQLLVPPLTFSAINYDEMLMGYFARITSLAALAAVLSVLGAVLASRVGQGTKAPPPPSLLALRPSLLNSALLAFGGLWMWYQDGLLSPLVLPPPGRLVAAYAVTLSVTSLTLVGLTMTAVLRVMERRHPAKEPSPRVSP